MNPIKTRDGTRDFLVYDMVYFQLKNDTDSSNFVIIKFSDLHIFLIWSYYTKCPNQPIWVQKNTHRNEKKSSPYASNISISR